MKLQGDVSYVDTSRWVNWGGGGLGGYASFGSEDGLVTGDRVTEVCSFWTSALAFPVPIGVQDRRGALVAVTVGVANSTTLSASSSISSRVAVVLLEASTMRTFGGSR